MVMAAGAKPFMVITPFSRFLHQACCEEPGHVSNLTDTDYKENMLTCLEGIRLEQTSEAYSLGTI